MKILLVILSILSSLCGCIPRGIPIEIYQGAPRYPTYPKKTIHLYKDIKDTFIKAIQIECGLSESGAMILWEAYKTSEYKKLSIFLIKTNYFTRIYSYGLQDRVYLMMVERVKARTKLLKKLKYAK